MRKFLKELAPRGIPVLGSGLIFPVTDDQITCKPIDYIPQHWPQLGAMDFGWEHPFAAVQLAWDRDADVVYVTKAYRMSRGTPVTHAGALRGWGRELRWACGLETASEKRWKGPALPWQSSTAIRA